VPAHVADSGRSAKPAARLESQPDVSETPALPAEADESQTEDEEIEGQ
jgi:hypothetical protein